MNNPENNLSPIAYFTYTYPQLTLQIGEGMSKSEEYLNITRRGIFPENLTFPMAESGMEERFDVDTPAGSAQVLYLPEREIFEFFIRVLAYRCEPVDIPANTGAMHISGINNLRKFLAGNPDYKDTVILITRGNYSGIDSKETKYTSGEWLEKSRTIRLYHELAHFVCRKKYIEHKDAVRDEIIADCIGIIAALGDYDTNIARTCLGIHKDETGMIFCRENGRLRNYIDASHTDKYAEYADALIARLKEEYIRCNKPDCFDFLIKVEEEYLK